MDLHDSIDVAVIGGGVAGLTAARILAATGLKVVVLEARGRVGGRILTRRPIEGPMIELGAGFVHGDNELLWELVQESGIQTESSELGQWVVERKKLREENDLWERLGEVMKKIDANNHSSLGSWLRIRPGGISAEEAAQAVEFVENFHGGTSDTTSADVLRATKGGTDESQHVVTNGYDRVPQVLAQQCYAAGVRIYLNAPVSTIEWSQGAAIVTSRPQSNTEVPSFRARAVIVTVPLGVLKARPGQLGAIQFTPEIPEKTSLWWGLPVGQVSRLTLRFRENFWAQSLLPAELRENNGKNFGFVHTHETPIPVWWSMTPEPVLVGWAGGPAARALVGKTKEQVVEIALRALSESFGSPVAAWASALAESFWHDWGADPYSRCGYSYTVANYEDAPQRLAAPVADTLFFAGEATAEPAELGTVGGALSSAERVAREVLRALPRVGANVESPASAIAE